MSGNWKAHLALLAANVIYGVNYTMAKIALPEYIKPFGFIFIRVTVAMVLFWLLHALFIREKIDRRDIPRLILCGATGVAANQLCFFYGLAITTEINASLIMITTPVLVLVLSHFLIHERLTILKILGILAGGIGAGTLIAFGKDLSLGSETLLGDLFILINATAYGLYLILVKPLMQKYRPLTVIKWVFLFGFPIVSVFGFPQFQQIEWSTFTGEVWLSLLYVVLGTTFLAYLLNVFALSKVNPSVVSVYIYAQPLVASMVAIAVGNDMLTVTKVFAGAMIFLGVYLTGNIRRKRRIEPN